jgi:hypothetical protein
MKRIPLALMVVGLVLSGCATPEPIVQTVYVTVAPPPSTYTPYPTYTSPPKATQTPSTPRITLADIEAALAEASYSRSPFYDEEGEEARGWTLDNPYEQVITWTRGIVRLEVLDKQSTRAERMERKLRLLDEVFPPEFMAKLRQENGSYMATAPTSVSGNPDKLYPPLPGDEWRTIWGQYNRKEVTIGSYDVTFALWFNQVTCPQGYICWMQNFPGQQFEGDTSLVFYTIEIMLSGATSGSSSSA